MRQTKWIAFVVLTMFTFVAYALPSDPVAYDRDNGFSYTGIVDLDASIVMSNSVLDSNDGILGDDNKTDLELIYVSYEVTQDAVGVNYADASLASATVSPKNITGGKVEVGWLVSQVL